MAPFRRLRQALGLRKGKLSRYVVVGRGTYGVDEHTVISATAESPVFIANFCSIAAGVRIHGATHHAFDKASTYPFRHFYEHKPEPGQSRGRTVIGNDVWIGSRAIILSGIVVGNGAVIGAGSVVSKDVPPYAIVVGNPARLVRYRFDEQTIAALLRIAWWNWPDEKIAAEVESFYGPIADFLVRHDSGKLEVS